MWAREHKESGGFWGCGRVLHEGSWGGRIAGIAGLDSFSGRGGGEMESARKRSDWSILTSTGGFLMKDNYEVKDPTPKTLNSTRLYPKAPMQWVVY